MFKIGLAITRLVVPGRSAAGEPGNFAPGSWLAAGDINEPGALLPVAVCPKAMAETNVRHNKIHFAMISPASS
jgi:hypothetical protein